MKQHLKGTASIELNKCDIHVLIVGGGRGGLAILDIFQACRDLIHIDCIVDINADAPALEAARAYLIPTSSNTEKSLAEFDGYIIIDVTGHDEVAGIIQKCKQPSHTEVISGHSARLLFDIVCHNH